MPDVTDESWYADSIATFGDRLAAAREAQGIRQEEFAQRLGVKLKTVRQWEEDAREPRANRLQMIAGMLGVSIMWLLTGEGPGVAPPSSDDNGKMTRLRGDLRVLYRDASELAGRIAALESRLERLIGLEAA
ncbi:helix-turn-helix domain-containing protein [Defluviimonas sp. WL0002]|uniref:Helix-turn-helix domain-containing protein n=1 Tax=Albidovulum marisflavi TaxID=2984159 RepID=A0ABT2ZBM8_9RHOB|nr:helix-turn-helix transcriptional regulator [Defluviimonas sp. WL0002]MCV2868186.1 helix-turn-helix domain-containing protein [Defluviimonas sp. WL0002]